MTDSTSHNLNVINQVAEELGTESVPSTLLCNAHPLMMFQGKINPLHAKDIYIHPGCTLLSAELISFCRPRMYVYVLKVFRILPQVLHSISQGRIYASSIYAARSQQRIYTSFLYSFLKSFGLKNVKGLASEIHFQIILKIMSQRINAFGSDKI